MNTTRKNSFHIFVTICCVLGLLVFNSCDNGFDAMNTDNTAADEIEPMMVLNNQIQLTPSSGAYGHLVYDMAIVQQVVAPFGQTFAGGNLNQDNQTPWVISYWDDDYSILSEAVTVIENTSDNKNYHNAHQKARIWRAYLGLLITDTVGDAPFSEAGLAYQEEEILEPAYDSQQSIYEAALDEIQDATESLDPNSRIESTDILYAGDIMKWKRFGNSLLLRFGMRLSEVNSQLAEQYVSAAYEGGVLQSNDDNAMVVRNESYNFSLAGTFTGGERHSFYLTDTFVDHLQNTDDPRLSSIAVRYVGAETIGDQDDRMNRSTDPGDQVGLEIGNDQSSIDNQVEEDGLESMYDYSQVDRDRMVSQQAPDFLITYAQTQLLLAEAAERGWIPGAGEDYFAEGIRAHMEQMEQHHSDMTISESDIDDYVSDQTQEYLSGNPYEHIHTQYWIAGFMINPRETFSNWRRTGYPELEPNPYPNQDISGDFIRRRSYLDRELSVNTQNVRDAIDNQGWSGNNLDARVWWDTESYDPN